MSKRKKTLVIAVLVVAVLVIAVLVALPRIIDPNKYRGLITDKASDALGGRKVELGPMALELWPGVGLEVKDIKVHDLKEHEPLVTAESLVVRVALLPLLGNKLEIKSIEVVSPRANLVRYDKDTWNVSDLLGEKDEQAGGAEEAEQGPSALERLEVAAVSVKDGRVEVDDRTAEDRKPFEFLIERLDLEDVLGQKPASISLRAGFSEDQGRIEVHGKAGPLMGTEGKNPFRFDLDASLAGFDLGRIARLVPPGTLPVTIISGILTGDVSAAMDADKVIESKGDIKLASLVYTDAEGTWPENDPADLEIEFTAVTDPGGALVIKPARLKVSGGELDISARYKKKGEAGVEYEAAVKSEGIDIEGFLALAPVAGRPLKDAGLSAKGPLSLDAAVKTSGRGVIESSLAADLTQATLSVPGSFHKRAGVPARLSSSASIGKQEINLTETKFALGSAAFAGGGKIKRDRDMNADVRLESPPADTRELMAMIPALKGYDLGGKAALALQVKGGLKNTDTLEVKLRRCDQESDKAKFSLTGSVRFTKPLLINFLLDAEKLDLDAVMPAGEKTGGSSGKKGPGSSDSLSRIRVAGKLSATKLIYQKMEMDNFYAEVKLADGVLTIPSTSMRAFDAPVKGSAKMDLAKSPLPGQVSVSTQGLPIESVIKHLSDYPAVIKGAAGGSISLSFRGTESASLQRTATGGGDVRLDNGSVQGVDFVGGLLSQWSDSGPVRNLAQGSLSPAVKTSISEQTSFDNITAAVKLKDGKVRFNKAAMEVKDGVVLMDGAVGLDKSVDLSGRLRLSRQRSRELLEQAGAYVEDSSGGSIKSTALNMLLDDGRLVLPFKLTGAWPRPKLALDLEAYGAIVSRNMREQAAGALIDTLLGGKKEEEPEQEEGAKEGEPEEEEEKEKDPRKVLEEEGRKLLEDLIPR